MRSTACARSSSATRSSHAPPRRSWRSGLHRLTVPDAAGGLGDGWPTPSRSSRLSAPSTVRRRSGSRCRSMSSGRSSIRPGSPDALRDRVYRAIVDEGALLNNAATEEGGGSPARGAIPGTVATAATDGSWRLTGEKTWITWLPEPDPRLRLGPGRRARTRSRSARGSSTCPRTESRGCPASRRWGCAARRPAGSSSTAWP